VLDPFAHDVEGDHRHGDAILLTSAVQDTATGVPLATMHLVTGAAFLVTAWRVGTQ